MTAQELISKLQETDPKSEVRVMYPDFRQMIVTPDFTIESDEEEDGSPFVTIQVL